MDLVIPFIGSLFMVFLSIILVGIDLYHFAISNVLLPMMPAIVAAFLVVFAVFPFVIFVTGNRNLSWLSLSHCLLLLLLQLFLALLFFSFCSVFSLAVFACSFTVYWTSAILQQLFNPLRWLSILVSLWPFLIMNLTYSCHHKCLEMHFWKIWLLLVRTT